MLKSLQSAGESANVYKTFKEKQSPSYRRKTDATPLRPSQTVYTVDIPIHDEPHPAATPAGA